MKIKVKKEVTEEKELELPYFFKNVYHTIKADHYAIFDDKRAMQVSVDSIICCSPELISSAMNNPRFAESTAEEFTEAYETTIRELTAMMPVTA